MLNDVVVVFMCVCVCLYVWFGFYEWIGAGMRFRDQLRAEIRELETSNMLNLIRSEKEEHKVMNSLEKLQNDLKGADTWLGDCDARLSSCTVVISDIEGEMRSLEVQMASAKVRGEKNTLNRNLCPYFALCGISIAKP